MVDVLPADNRLCPIDSPKPRPPVPAGTRVPGAGSIGRLELEVKKGPAKGLFFWATAFKVGEKTDKKTGETYDLVATTCHALQPLIKQPDVNQPWQYNPSANENLWLDYGERTDYPPRQKYLVKSLVAYGQKKGLDVALLEVYHSDAKSLPFEKPSAQMTPLIVPIPITVIGYVDFLHPVDPLIDMSYNPFLLYGDNKFVTFGRFTQIGKRVEDSKAVGFDDQYYMYHDAATSMGQSGSPVFRGEDLKSSSGTLMPVLGVHVCCTAYWDKEKGDPPVDDKSIPCGRITRGVVNKAVMYTDILNDSNLCSALKGYGNPTYQCY